MTFVGEPISDLQFGFFVAFAAISCAFFLIQIIYLQKLSMLPVILLPVISFLMCFENCVLCRGSSVGSRSALAVITLILHSMITPLMLLTMFELPFRLHQARTAHFLCIPFEQGAVFSRDIAKTALWAMRIFALGIFVVDLIADFQITVNKHGKAGLAGYAVFGDNRNHIHLWLSLLPAVVLSLLAIVISVVMQRYAKNCSLGVRTHNFHWRYLLPLSLLYTLSRCFGTYQYAVLSNAGDICILIALTVLTYRLQLDLAVAGSFADFLHRSNVVFRGSHSLAGSSDEKNYHAVIHKPPLHPKPPVTATTTTAAVNSPGKSAVASLFVSDDLESGAVAQDQDSNSVVTNGAIVELDEEGIALGSSTAPASQEMIRDLDDVQVTLDDVERVGS